MPPFESADIARAAAAPATARARPEPGARAAPCPPPGQEPRAAAGAGEIAFARVDGATSVVRCAARSPLQLLLPRPRGASAWAVVATHGGGLVAGDAVDLAVEVRPGAAALLT